MILSALAMSTAERLVDEPVAVVSAEPSVVEAEAEEVEFAEEPDTATSNADISFRNLSMKLELDPPPELVDSSELSSASNVKSSELDEVLMVEIADMADPLYQ